MKKKIFLGLGIFLGVCLIGGGIWYAVAKTNQKAINVAPVADLSTGYMGNDISMSGTVSSNATQEVHLTDKQVIDEVFVEEGASVDVGTPLLSYDMTMVNLNLEAEKLNKEGLEIKKKGLENELAKLKKTKPVKVSTKGTNDKFERLAFTADDPGAAPIVYDVLDDKSVPYKGTGTTDDPYTFLCKKVDETTDTGKQYPVKIKGVFLNIMKKAAEEGKPCVIRLEIKNDEGILLKARIMDGADLTRNFADETEYTLYLSQIDMHPTPTPEPTPTETPSETPTEKPTETPSETPPETPTKTPTPTPTEAPPIDQDEVIEGDILDFGEEVPDDEIIQGYSKDELDKMIRDKQAEIKLVQLDIKQSDLKLVKLEKNMENQTVTSTLKGTVKSVGDPKKGEVDGKAFIVVESTEGLYVKGSVSELMLDAIKPGQMISGMAQESGVAFDAEVREVSPYPANSSDSWGGNMNSSYYPFTAYIADGNGLKNQEYVQFNVTVGSDEAASSIYIPKAYVRKDGADSYVYIADADGKLKKQIVSTGKVIYGYAVEVKAGLTSEDLIAFPYGKGVKDGAAVKQVTVDQMMM
ncbi:MAG: hypothetical protein PHS82_16080 [Lachnospiraceae bacterium]|nr:hypothetical protein [Lachnospiraceae bacterium]